MARPRCHCCGQFFKPYPQQGARQKTCGQPSCRQIRQRRKYQDWIKRHPWHRAERKTKVQGWAKAYPDYWRQYRAGHSEYQERERSRMKGKRGRARRVAKQTAWSRIAVEKLRVVRRMGPKTVAKQTAWARRVNGIVDFLWWKETVAKQRPIEAGVGPGG